MVSAVLHASLMPFLLLISSFLLFAAELHFVQVPSQLAAAALCLRRERRVDTDSGHSGENMLQKIANLIELRMTDDTTKNEKKHG